MTIRIFWRFAECAMSRCIPPAPIHNALLCPAMLSVLAARNYPQRQ
jgi:hypothetical protein